MCEEELFDLSPDNDLRECYVYLRILLLKIILQLIYFSLAIYEGT